MLSMVASSAARCRISRSCSFSWRYAWALSRAMLVYAARFCRRLRWYSVYACFLKLCTVMTPSTRSCDTSGR